jgi:hypothetical protein
MTTVHCPTCGAECLLRGGAPYAVCRYCKSLLVRSDVSLESVGRVAAVPDDFSPLQLGVTGQFGGRPFTVVGRLRKVWEEGSWNEWCVLFEDQRFGWLGEAQGDWVMTFEAAAAAQGLPAADQAARVDPGTRWRLDGRAFTVTDVKQVSCEGAEGELAEIYRPGEQALCIDLQGSDRGFATVEFRAAAVKAYLGRFVEFDECRFENLRQLDGWGARS